MKLAWEVYVETKAAQDEHGFFVFLDSTLTWEDFVEHRKQEYHPEDTNQHKYIQWQLLRQKKDQLVQEF